MNRLMFVLSLAQNFDYMINMKRLTCVCDILSGRNNEQKIEIFIAVEIMDTHRASFVDFVYYSLINAN
ncbi:MAG: hypothetical protein ACI8Y3_000044 [Paraglaciecola sp.]|jgi:hypothetical protein